MWKILTINWNYFFFNLSRKDLWKFWLHIVICYMKMGCTSHHLHRCYLKTFYINTFWTTIKFRKQGVIFGGAYHRWKICVSKSAGLVIGGKFVSASFQCTTDNIGVLTGNSWQPIIPLNMPSSNTTAINLIENRTPYIQCKSYTVYSPYGCL